MNKKSTSNDHPMEVWSAKEHRDSLQIEMERELIQPSVPARKLVYMLAVGPGGPTLVVTFAILAFLTSGKLTELYFIGLVALGFIGTAATLARGKRHGP